MSRNFYHAPRGIPLSDIPVRVKVRINFDENEICF